MFSISSSPISTDQQNKALAHPQAGALVTFEGWVRNQNEGQHVVALEYECYEALALKEGKVVLNEARAKFDILEVRSIHRVGKLTIGEVAVWVGVISKHRGDAFRAAEFVINQIKVRLPIWKKEFYINGDSGWVNCEACASHAHSHDHGKHSSGAPHVH